VRIKLYLFNIYSHLFSQKTQYKDLSWRDLSKAIVKGAPLNKLNAKLKKSELFKLLLITTLLIKLLYSLSLHEIYYIMQLPG